MALGGSSPKSPKKTAAKQKDFFGRPLSGAQTPRSPKNAQGPSTPEEEPPSFFSDAVTVTVGRLRAAPNSAMTRQQVYRMHDLKGVKGRAARETAIEPDVEVRHPTVFASLSSLFSAPASHCPPSHRRRRSKSHKGPRR